MNSVPKTWVDVYLASMVKPTRKQFYRVLRVVFDLGGIRITPEQGQDTAFCYVY